VGQGEAAVYPGEFGGRFLEVCGPEVKDSLNVTAAKPSTVYYSVKLKKTTDGPRRGETERQFKRGPGAGINMATVAAEEMENKAAPRARERGSRKCKFS
jgi:hypothetical protein